MGFFAQIASEVRRNGVSGALPQPAAPEFPEQQRVLSQEPPPEPAPAPEQPPAPDAHTLPPPELKLDVTNPGQSPNDDAKRKAHEAAEAKRKAEWDAKQAKKKAARQAQMDKIAAMDRAELLAASVERVAADTEKLTRRNMKEAVAEHVQAKCREDAAFAVLVMDPEKSMINCFKYITRKAREYAEQEMKDNGIERRGVYGLDVPDGLCFQWAENYFHDPDAEEDHKNDEKFVPKPYVPASAPRKAAKGKAGKKPASAAKPEAGKPKDSSMEQISLM